jgi:hypothetical protein
MSQSPQHAPHPPVDSGRLWAGGAAAAVVAALIAVAGIVLARGVFNIPILAREDSGAWGDASTVWYAAVSALAALLATALVHGLIRTTPEPRKFFSWIIGLVTVIAALLPFTSDGNLEAEIATAVLNVVIGIAIGSLVSSVARNAIAAAIPPAPGVPPPPMQ